MPMPIVVGVVAAVPLLRAVVAPVLLPRRKTTFRSSQSKSVYQDSVPVLIRTAKVNAGQHVHTCRAL